jgi:hypothetical protein
MALCIYSILHECRARWAFPRPFLYLQLFFTIKKCRRRYASETGILLAMQAGNISIISNAVPYKNL